MRRLCLVFAFAPATLSAQAGGIEAMVRNQSGDPVRGATVRMETLDRRGVTDSAGMVLFREIPAGRHVLAVRAVGMIPVDAGIAVADTVSRLTITLRPVTLPAVEVTAKNGMPRRYAGIARFEQFYERRARNAGTFFTREDIESTGSTDIVDVLRRVAGARIARNPYARDMKLDVRFARCTVSSLSGSAGSSVAVYVNGLRSSKGGAMIILDELKTNEVEAMEVYVGPSQLPLEAMGDACAAIYIWTRFLSGDKVK